MVTRNRTDMAASSRGNGPAANRNDQSYAPEISTKYKRKHCGFVAVHVGMFLIMWSVVVFLLQYLIRRRSLYMLNHSVVIMS